MALGSVLQLLFRLSYPVFILQDLLSRTKNISAPQKQLVMYDVACMLRKHLEVRKSQLLQHFTFSVPAFHRFAHNMACQVWWQTCYLIACVIKDTVPSIDSFKNMLVVVAGQIVNVCFHTTQDDWNDSVFMSNCNNSEFRRLSDPFRLHFPNHCNICFGLYSI